MKYNYQVYVESGYYHSDLDFSYTAVRGLWLPFGSEYQGHLCVF